MTRKKKLTVNERIEKEYQRLRKEYNDLPEPMINVLEKTIRNTATLEIRVEDLSEYLHEHGYTEPFTQSPNTPPYDRERVETKEYKDFIKLNQTNYRVLSDAMNKYLSSRDNEEEDDGFESFLDKR